MGRGEQPEELRHESDVENWHDTEVQGAAHLSRIDADLVEKTFHLAENGAGVLLEDEPGGGEENAFPATLEKGDAQRGLEITHLLGDVRLGDAEAIGGAAETPRLRDGEEIA